MSRRANRSRGSSLAIPMLILWGASTPHLARAQALDREVLQHAKGATVLVIRVEQTAQGMHLTSGSGFFATPRGHVVASSSVVAAKPAGHAARRGESIQVVVNSGLPTQRVVAAKVVRLDGDLGLALLETKTVADFWLIPADAPEPAETTAVWALGFPATHRLPAGARGPAVTITGGTITSLRRGPDGKVRRIQTNAVVQHGTQGGPLIDASGRAVGAMVLDKERFRLPTMALAVPSRAVHRFLGGLSLAPGDAYKDAVAYRAEHPHDLRGCCARFRHVVRGWPKSRWALAAGAKLVELLATWDELARAEMLRRTATARQKAGQEDYTGAIATLRGFPEQLLNDRWSREIETAVAPYVEASVRDMGYHIRRRQLQDALWPALLPHLRARNYDLVLAAAEESLRGNKGREVDDTLALVEGLVETAKAFWDAVLKGAAQRKGRTIRLRGILYEVKGAEGGSLILGAGAVEKRASVRELPVVESAALADWSGPRRRSHYAVACLCAFDGQWQHALRCAAQSDEASKRDLLAWIPQWRAASAQMLLDEAKADLAAGKAQAALKTLLELKGSYGDVDVVKESDGWIDGAITDLRKRRAPEPRPARESPFRRCPRCHGHGTIPYVRREAGPAGTAYYKAYKKCPLCQGKRKIPRQMRP